VVIDRATDADDTSLFGDEYLRARPVAGELEGIRTLVERLEGRILS